MPKYDCNDRNYHGFSLDIILNVPSLRHNSTRQYYFHISKEKRYLYDIYMSIYILKHDEKKPVH